MNITRRAGAALKSSSETRAPSVSGSEKSGAGVPSGSMLDGVRTIGHLLCPQDQGTKRLRLSIQNRQSCPETPGQISSCTGSPLERRISEKDRVSDVRWSCSPV